MEIVCVELPVWENLKRQISKLTSEMVMMRKLCTPNPRDG